MFEYISAIGLASLWTIQPYILKYVNHVDPIITWMFTLIFTAVIVYFLFFSKNNAFDIHHMDLMLICIASLIGIVMAPLLYIYLINNSKNLPFLIALVFSFTVILSNILSYIFLKERPTIISIFAITLICTGILLLAKK